MRKKMWFCLAFFGGMAASQSLAVSLDYTEAPPEKKTPDVEAAIRAPTIEEGDAVDKAAKRDLIISPSGAVLTDPLDHKHAAGERCAATECPLEDFEQFIKTTEMTMDAALPVLEAGHVFLQGIGGMSFEFVELETALKDVLEETKERQRAISASLTELPPVKSEGPAPVPGYSPALGENSGESDGGMGGGFGVAIVIIFVVVLGAGIVMKC